MNALATPSPACWRSASKPPRTSWPSPWAATPAPPAAARKAKLPAARKGLAIAGTLGFLLFTALLIRTGVKPPQLIDVLNIQRYYVNDGKLIQRDSNPIEASDAYFFITKDSYVVNDAEYFDYLKTGLSLSDNFYDKYDSPIIRRRIMMAFFAILAGLSLAAAAVPLFLSKEQKTVGAARGSDWKS